MLALELKDDAGLRDFSDTQYNCYYAFIIKKKINDFSNLQSSRTMSFSAPSAINMEHSVVKFDMEHESVIRIVNETEDEDHKVTSQESIQIQTVDLNYPSHDWQSLSCLTDSTEHSAPINFDMSNRV